MVFQESSKSSDVIIVRVSRRWRCERTLKEGEKKKERKKERGNKKKKKKKKKTNNNNYNQINRHEYVREEEEDCLAATFWIDSKCMIIGEKDVNRTTHVA
jgi:hypothetical protein